jgi:hypothetical protein
MNVMDLLKNWPFLIQGEKPDELNQDLEALDHQVAQIEKFWQLSPEFFWIVDQ